MIEFLVHVHSPEDSRAAEKRLRRLSHEELGRRQESLQRTVAACSRQIRRLLPPGAELSVLEATGGIVVSVPSDHEIRTLQERIRAECGDVVVGFGTDAEIELLQQPQARRRP